MEASGCKAFRPYWLWFRVWVGLPASHIYDLMAKGARRHLPIPCTKTINSTRFGLHSFRVWDLGFTSLLALGFDGFWGFCLGLDGFSGFREPFTQGGCQTQCFMECSLNHVRDPHHCSSNPLYCKYSSSMFMLFSPSSHSKTIPLLRGEQ